jgi:hypothetical protein
MSSLKSNIIGFEKTMPKSRNNERKKGRYVVKMDYPVVVSKSKKSMFFSDIQASIKDISDDGIGLSFKETLDIGAKIHLDILFHGCRFSVSGEVVHKRPFRDFFFYGVKIDAPAKALRKFIVAYENDED